MHEQSSWYANLYVKKLYLTFANGIVKKEAEEKLGSKATVYPVIGRETKILSPRLL